MHMRIIAIRMVKADVKTQHHCSASRDHVTRYRVMHLLGGGDGANEAIC